MDERQSEQSAEPYRYEKLSWPELDAAAEAEKLVVVPVGSTEDHGHHLPLDVDQVLPESICDAVVADRDDALLFPTVTQGYLPHHMDFPGGVTIRWDTFVNYVIDIGVTLAHHGFDKILFVNGHGSNHHLLEQATRQVCLQYPRTHCAMISWWDIEEVLKTAEEIREAGPQGAAHGGEVETSLYLYLDGDRVDMARASRDLSTPESDHLYRTGLFGDKPEAASTPITMVQYYSTLTETGVRGDATLATAEKGKRLYEAAVEGLDAVLDGFREYPHREIDDKHARDVTDDEYDPFRPR